MVEYECQGGEIDRSGLKHHYFFYFFLLIIIITNFLKHAHKGLYIFIYIWAARLYKNDKNPPIGQQ